MKPYGNPSKGGNTKGHTTLTHNCPTRKRALRRDRKAARSAGKVGPANPDTAAYDYPRSNEGRHFSQSDGT